MFLLGSRGYYLSKLAQEQEPINRNFDFIDHFRKAFELEKDLAKKEGFFNYIKHAEALRDYQLEIMHEIKNLIQYDTKPIELNNVRSEAFKVSFSFTYRSKLFKMTDQCTDVYSGTVLDTVSLKGTNNRVLFQNADGDINMGILFNDPDVDIYDICWLNQLELEIEIYLAENDGQPGEFISIDDELNTRSMYIQMHRKD